MPCYDLCNTMKAQLDKFRPFPPETLQSLRNYYRVGLTWSSNALEGNSLTESETKVVIEDGLTVHGKPLHDIYEALGHAEAYDYIYAMAESKDLTPDDICKLHGLFFIKIIHLLILLLLIYIFRSIFLNTLFLHFRLLYEPYLLYQALVQTQPLFQVV